MVEGLLLQFEKLKFLLVKVGQNGFQRSSIFYFRP